MRSLETCEFFLGMFLFLLSFWRPVDAVPLRVVCDPLVPLLPAKV